MGDATASPSALSRGTGRILTALDRYRPYGWLAVDVLIRNLSGAGRDDLADYVLELKLTLARFAARRFIYGVGDPLRSGSVAAAANPLRRLSSNKLKLGRYSRKGRPSTFSFSPTIQSLRLLGCGAQGWDRPASSR